MTLWGQRSDGLRFPTVKRGRDHSIKSEARFPWDDVNIALKRFDPEFIAITGCSASCGLHKNCGPVQSIIEKPG